MKALTILKRAKALIDAGRWIKGEFHEPSRRINVRTGQRDTKSRKVTCYCASGAIRAVAGKHDFSEAESFFLEAIGFRRYQEPSNIWDWHDASNRTVKDVRAAFRKAVRLAERASA